MSRTLTLLSYLGIAYKGNAVVKDVLNWFEFGIDFLNYGNPMQELRMAVSTSEDVKHLMLDMIQEMDLDIVDFRVEEKEDDMIEVFTKHRVDEVETEVFNMEEREIPSQAVGEMVMNKLKDLDAVAYVRFASVYREFKDINTFMDELKSVLNK